MIEKYQTKQLKLNADLRGHRSGQVIPIKVRGKVGSPVDRYWRDRLKDAKIDKCVEFVTKKSGSGAVKPPKSSTK